MVNLEFVSSVPPVGKCKITIGDFSESFETSLVWWTPQEYKAQWNSALQEIISGAPRSALLSSIADPQSANFVFCWALYREKTSVVIQNLIIFLDETPVVFDPSKINEYLGERESNFEGESISKWRVPFSSILDINASRAETLKPL